MHTDTAAVIALRDVHKRYGSLTVLDGLDLTVQAGEVYGFLGRNGAGKSTAIRLMMGISQIDEGSIHLFGQSISRHAIALRQRVGYVAQEQNFYPWMTPKRLEGFVKGFYPRWDPQRYRQLIGRFELPDKQRIGTFSGGMKAKMALTMALATRPEVLILDEPTAGMDPVARREFLDLVREQAVLDGATIFFSTHLIDEIEDVADRIGIVEAGKTMYEGALAPLADAVIAFSLPLDEYMPGATPAEGFLASARLLYSTERQGRRLLVAHDPEHVARTLPLQPGWRPEALTLEDVFIAVVSRSQPG